MKFKTIKQITDHLEQLNIQVHNYFEDKKLCGYELNTYTNAGVNMIIFVDFRGSKMKPKNAKDFITIFNERINSVDIEEEIGYLRQDKSYMQDIGTEIGLQDLKEWKESLQSIFSSKSAEQRQFEQVVDKLRSQLEAMKETLDLMPKKGDTANDCQRQNILCTLIQLDHEINGIELEDFTPNEYSGDFKLSYS